MPLTQGTAHLLHGFQDRPPGEVDFHGLYVKEAISYAVEALDKAIQRGDSELRLIVGMHSLCIFKLLVSWSLPGQGKHADGGVARLKPALQDAMET